MTRRYEMMVILDPGQSEEVLAKQIEKLEEMIKASEGGEILNVDKWGKKRLAYEIDNKQFGYYIVFEFLCNTQLPKELDRSCRLDANIVRHMILSIPDRVLKLKEREEELKARLELRRKKIAEQSDDNVVVDMLSEQGDEDSDSDDSDSEPEEKAAAEEDK